MNGDFKRKCYKFSSVMGALIIMLPNGVAMYWGNMAVYVTSYFVVCLDIAAGVESPWIACLFVVFWIAAIMVYDFVHKYVARPWLIVLGAAVITDIGIFTSYFAVKTSFVLLNITLSVLVGIGTGFLQVYTLRLLVDWADGDTGLLTAIGQGSFYFGASIVNQIVTLYVNPENGVPNIRIRNSAYFTDPRVLDRVPSMFLVLGCFTIACQVVGYALLRENTFHKPGTETRCNDEQVLVLDTKGNGYKSFTKIKEDAIAGTAISSSTDEGSTKMNVERRPTVRNGTTAVNDSKPNYTPREVLHTVSFYIMWTVFFSDEYAIILVNNYFKSFGQLRIHDDHFLTDLGTMMAVINLPVRIISGVAMDKIGFMNCMKAEILLVALLSSWFFFTVALNKWLYFLVAILLNSFSGAVFNSTAIVAVEMFGKKHFSMNFGLFMSSSMIMGLLCPFFTDAILHYLGWFYIFASCGLLNAIGLFLILYLDGFVMRLQNT